MLKDKTPLNTKKSSALMHELFEYVKIKFVIPNLLLLL